MYFFVDESGNTGANLFDDTQPILYYGVLSSHLNVDNLASDAMKELRAILGVDRLHANVLGMGRLVQIAKGLLFIQEQLDLRFDFHSVHKLDHALICFFDQVFDQGVNPAVPWSAYWTPLRYILLLKIAPLFDVEILKKAWNARIQKNNNLAEAEFSEVCKTLLSRLEAIPDERSRQIVRDALIWASDNYQKILYNTQGKRETYWITPNLIGFQNVLRSIAIRIKENSQEPPIIVVDQQAQFNQTQRSLAEYYAEAKGLVYDFGTGLPEIDFTGMPDTPILFKSGLDSVGLELVDIYLWLFKQLSQKKEIAHELRPLVRTQIYHGLYYEISLNAIAERWTEWFEKLPEPTPDQWKSGKEIVQIDERRRLAAIVENNQRNRLLSTIE
jgi:hypothetical protein